MNREGIYGDIATYGGSVGSCASASVASSAPGESTVLFYLSLMSFLIAAAGLAFSVYNGNRQFKLARLELDIKLQQQHDHMKAILPAGVVAPGEAHGTSG